MLNKYPSVVCNGSEILTSDEQPSNIQYFILALGGITMLVKLVQFEKAYGPMLVTPLPMLMLCIAVQPEKAYSPIFATLFGITILSRFRHP